MSGIVNLESHLEWKRSKDMIDGISEAIRANPHDTCWFFISELQWVMENCDDEKLKEELRCRIEGPLRHLY